MSDEKALIDRLREMASEKNSCRYSIGEYWNVCDEAADEIERLRADAMRWRYFIRNAKLEFAAPPSYDAVIRLPIGSSDDTTIVALVDRLLTTEGTK
jgi:hypothetical protein